MDWDKYEETIVNNSFYPSARVWAKIKINKLQKQIDELRTMNESLAARIKHLEDKS